MSERYGRITVQREYSFWCACGRIDDYHPAPERTMAGAIKEARKDGWRRRKAGWTCPSCAPADA